MFTRMQTQTRRRDDEGFTTMWVLGLVAIVMILGLAVFEVWHVYVVQRRLTAMADSAAAAGAQGINEAALVNSTTPELDPTRASDLAGVRLTADLADAGLKSCAAVDPARTCVVSAVTVRGVNPGDPPTVVTVTLHRSVQFAVFSALGLRNMEISASSSASPRVG